MPDRNPPVHDGSPPATTRMVLPGPLAPGPGSTVVTFRLNGLYASDTICQISRIALSSVALNDVTSPSRSKACCGVTAEPPHVRAVSPFRSMYRFAGAPGRLLSFGIDASAYVTAGDAK